MTFNTRTRLLACTAVAITGTVGIATPAQAACTIAGTVLTCTSTTTTDTIYPVNVPSDRGYDLGLNLTQATVSAGAVVDGFGLAFGGQADPFTITNNGVIQVNVGLTPTVGTASALYVTTTGTVNYNGTGDVINLGTGAGIDVDIAGTGSFIAAIGGSVRADAGDAISVSGNAGTVGAIGVTTVTGETIRASAGDGIDIDQAGSGNVTVTNAAPISSGGVGVNTLQDGINVTSTGTGNISIANTGAIGAAGDRAQLTGITASIANAASAGTISVTGSGAIFSVGDGIAANTTGTGGVTVNYTGAINVSSAVDDGIDVDTTTGNISVTTGAGAITGGFNGIATLTNTGTNSVTTGTGAVTGGAFGVQIVSNGVAPGAQTTTVGGVVTGTTNSGIRSFSDGGRTITIGAAGNVTGGMQAIELVGIGTTTIANSGIIGGTATGLAILDSGGGDSTITNAATGTLNGVLSLGAGADVVANAGLWNVSGAVDFGAGTDRLQNTGRITLAGNTTLVGLESIGSATVAGNAGRIDLGTFTLTGPAIVFTNNATGNVTTSGNATLAGFTSVANAGSFTLGAGTLTVPASTFTNTGSVIARSGASTLTGQTSFLNTGGQLLLNDGATNDTLTINSNFTASGNSRLTLDIDNTSADRLIINGNVTGATNVILLPIAGTTGINTAGVLIVDVNGTAAANAFTTTSVLNSVVDFAIEQRGTDFFAITLPNANAFSPVLLGNLAMDSWYQGAEAFNAMAAALGGEQDGFAVWLQPYYSKDRYGDATHTFTALGRNYTIPTRMRTTRQGIQGGADFNVGMATIGLTGGYQQAEVNNGSPTQPNPPAVLPALGIESQIDGYNIGAYAMIGGTEGIYGTLLGKYDKNKINLDGVAFDGANLDSDSTSFGVDGEVGYRFAGSGSIGFDASAGLAYVSSEIDDFAFGGINYGYDDLTSMRGRIGARAVFRDLARLFIGGKLMHEFSGDTDLALDSATDTEVGIEGRGTWARLEAGFGGGADTPFMAQAWGDFGDVKGWGVRGGLRFGFGGEPVVEEAPAVLPPPPPPPVEPAPVVEEPAPPPPPPPPPPAAPGQRG